MSLYLLFQTASQVAQQYGGTPPPCDCVDAEKIERAKNDISTLMAACIDYRNTLVRAAVPDPVSGHHEGVEAIFEKYNVVVEPRKMTAPGIVTAYIRS